MKIIEISEDKVSTLSENIEKGLRYIGKAMQVIDDMGRGGKPEYGERWDDDDEERYERLRIEGGSRYGNRYGSGGGYGMRRYR